ncbi:N-acetylglucosamine kinase [Devosia sp. LjRoot3]|uniref:N-acetylglucosamine kinase n=1 Tax=Devosia sp. LjRoot3 TaxID=3342319 RepID=UPI003ECD2693
MTAVHLGVDVGGTASRWVACDDSGAVLARGKTSGATGHLFNPVEKERLRTALGAIAGDLKAHGFSAKSATTGLTGFGAGVSGLLREQLVEFFGVAAECCITVDDMTLAYASIFKPGEGHLISAGTGSIGLHIGTGDAYVRVGGRGILIDDAGSGSWIALKALDTLFRRLDHDGSFAGVAVLADEIAKRLGSVEWHVVREFVYGGDRGRIGTLSVAVGAAAERGDLIAREILASAGRELALMGSALTGRVGQRPIGFVGGVLALPGIRQAIVEALAGHEVIFPEADAALAAARMQTDVSSEWRAALAGNSGLA